MNFVVSSNILTSRLQAISKFVSSKSTMAILDCILFELRDGMLYLTASDGDNTAVTSLEPVSSSGSGAFCIPARSIIDSLRDMGDQPLSFKEQDLAIEVAYQNGVYNMIAQAAEAYPSLKQLEGDYTTVTIPAQKLLNAVNRTIFASSADEIRPVMSGIYFDITPEYTTIVATDGRKLVRNRLLSVCGTSASSFILPKKPANLVRSILTKEMGDVEISFDTKNALVRLEDYEVHCHLIEGRYPNYNSVIPQNNPYHVTVNGAAFMGALKRVLNFSSSTYQIKMEVKPGLIDLSAKDIDFSTSAQEKIPCDYEDANIKIGFKGSFLVDMLNNIGQKDVIFELGDPSRPGILRPVEQDEEEDLLMLIMPMILND
jgi:DNA polymerase-3 subunit beta